MEHPPLKRHESLQPFSRDHYVGLVAAQRLLRAATQDPASRRAAREAFVKDWRAEVAVHFADEERLLMPLMDEMQRQRLLGEHGRLRELAQQAEAVPPEGDMPADLARDLGQQLNDHIRWEERELFPAMERALLPGQLEELLLQTRAFEATRPRGLRKARPGD